MDEKTAPTRNEPGQPDSSNIISYLTIIFSTDSAVLMT